MRRVHLVRAPVKPTEQMFSGIGGDMSEKMTPETLRELAMQGGRPPNDALRLRAAADAWEKQVAVERAANKELATSLNFADQGARHNRDVIADLRKRLEVAECMLNLACVELGLEDRGGIEQKQTEWRQEVEANLAALAAGEEE